MAGLTNEGFETKTQEDIRNDLESGIKSGISQQVNTEPSSPTGVIIDQVTGFIRELWELGFAVWVSNDPDAATGLSLDNLTQLTGTTRRAATPSTVQCDVTLDPGTSFNPGELVAAVVGIPDRQFQNTEIAANPEVTQQVKDVAFASLETGEVVAAAGTLTEIVTPQVGWVAITNPLDATLGREDELDPALRTRREQEIDQLGGCTLPAIRADVLALEGMVSVTVFENDTSVTDGDGLPPKSFEVVAYDGTKAPPRNVEDKTIAQKILDSKPAGIATFGTTTEVVEDTDGQSRTINFSRPTIIDIYVEVDLNVTSDYAPAEKDDVVKEAIVREAEATFKVGDDVLVGGKWTCAVFIDDTVEALTAVRLSTVAFPGASVDIPIAARELADFDTSRINVFPTV